VKETFLRIERVTTGASMYFACTMMALAAGLGVFQILTRFVLEKPAEWTEVMIRFSLIWMVFMGIPMAFRQGAMVSVDVLYRWSKPGMQRVLDAVVMIASLSLITIIIVIGWDYAQRGRVQTIIGLEEYSMFWAYIAMPIGGVFAIMGIVGNFLDPKRLELETAQ
jgi:TRAP-type C4-dicarboxylate transport system permease small subunit